MSENDFVQLYKGSLIPLRTILASLTWLLHDYCITLEDEITHIWSQKNNVSKFLYLWMRYYTIGLLVFDVAQIHEFSRPGVTNAKLCIAMDWIIRVVGGVSLWSVEIIMQLRIYALYDRSMRVVLFNGGMFFVSIGAFIGVLIHDARARHAVIGNALDYPLPGCPTIHTGIEWAQWIPATVFEVMLFGFAIYKSIDTAALFRSRREMVSLYTVLLQGNIFYFFAVACLLVFNLLMVIRITHIPWFSYGPFHAALGILTCRMLINFRKTIAQQEDSRHKIDMALERVHLNG